jgi:alpha-L-rhamnosidase
MSILYILKFFRASIVSLFAIFFLFLFCSQNMETPGAPNKLQCEYQSKPLGFDVQKPRLSWKVNDNRRGAVQTAYQVLVASDEELLQQDKGDIWDTGKVDSDLSVNVPYGGSVLESQKNYFWKVRTWDKDGEPMPFSNISWWETGLLKPNDWEAKWIGKHIEVKEAPKDPWPWGYWIWHPTEKDVDKIVYLRKSFKLPKKKVKTALIRTTADNYFTAYINGKEVGNGDQWTTVYEFDVKQILKSGKNLVAVQAANNLGDVCGFIFSLKIEFDDGSSQVINSDKTWKTLDKKKRGWENIKYKDKKWKKVTVIEKYGGSSWGRIDPTDEHHPPKSILVRNEFTVDKKVKQARAYVSGLGIYVIHLNGQKVGNDIFTPGWTDFPTKVQYQTYDVTSLIKQGKNGVGAYIGNMWWSSGLGWRGANTYSNGPMRFLLQLVLDFEDGTSETFITDEKWKTTDSPVLENHIYHGETYDARLEKSGWDKSNFDDSAWEDVVVVDEKAKLVAQQGPTIQVTEELTPVKITEPSSDVFVFDLGQNMVGWVKLKVKGEAGTKIVLRFAETLKDDGNIYTENLRGAKATDNYILKGNGTEEWEPRFTYHGFRFVEITGYPGKPGKDAVTGKVLHSNPPLSGKFACSNELINKIQKNINWGLRGNLHSVPTDCPQRDERLGWMGDAQIFAPTSCYNRNMARFYTKWERDIIDCQDEDGAVHDVNPTIVVGGPAKPGWGDAVVVIPWVVYNFYGDKRIIEESYDGMVAWVNYMKNNAKNYIYDRKGYGDWIAVVKSPSEPIGAAYFYYSTKLLAKMAAIIGKDEEALNFEQLADKIGDAFNKKYLDVKTFQYESNTQTANLLPLAFGITPDWLADKVIANVALDIKKKDMHPSTGFLGTGYILPMLSEYGYHDLAYKLASQNTYPSWGYMVEKNATTIWELWNSDTEGPGMNSRNHFALGSVGEWYFSHLAGLRTHPEAPGFKKVIIKPMPIGDLKWAEASLETAYGTVRSRWEKKKGKLSLSVSIPANTSAMLYVPTLEIEEPSVSERGLQLLDDGKFVNNSDALEFKELTPNAVVFKIGAGEYEFMVW